MITVGFATVTAAAPPEPRTLTGHTGWVGGVAFSPDGKTLATASADKTVKLWDVETGKEIAALKGHTDYVSCVAFSPDGKLLATGSYDHTAKLWDVEKRTALHTLKGHKGAVLTVSFRPDPLVKVLVTGGIDGQIYACDYTDSPPELRPFCPLVHQSWVNAVAQSSEDAYTIASAGSDGELHLGYVGTGAIVEPKAAELRSLAYSPDGKLLAVGTRYGLVKVYSVSNTHPKELATLKGKHGGDVWAVAFSADGKTLASADGDWNRPGDIRLWDTKTWTERGKLQHSGEVLCLAFSPKKPLLAAGAWDKTVKLWDLSKDADK